MSNASAAAIASEQYQLANISDTKVPAIIVCNAICLAAACVAVILRIIARRLIKISLQADDWVILLALVCCLASSHYNELVDSSADCVIDGTALCYCI